MTSAVDRLRRRLADHLEPETLLDDVDRASAERTELERCEESAVYWIRRYGWLADPKQRDPADRELRFDLWPEQQRAVEWLLEGYESGIEQMINKSREIGATWLAMHLIWWLWRFEPAFSALLISRKEKLVDDGGNPRHGGGSTLDSLFGKLDFITARQPAFLRPRTYRRKLLLKNLDNGSKIAGESTAEGAARSTRHSVVLVDEAAQIDARKQRSLRTSLESVGRSTWWISTPNGRGNEFAFMAAQYAAEPRHRLDLGWRSDPRRTLEWFEGLLVENGGPLSWDKRAQEYGCSFAGVSGVRVFKPPGDGLLYDDGSLPECARERWFLVAAMDFGSGPSWSTCVWFLCSWDHSPHETLPIVYLDLERVWSRTRASEIGADIVESHQSSGYGGAYFYTGDPAGSQVDAEQESWESRLQAAGVPIVCLPYEFNAPGLINGEGIDEVQLMLDGELLKLHRERAPLTRQTLESWEWDLPPGIRAEDVNREVLKPRKDSWSHLGQAVIYAIAWLVRYGRRSVDEYGEIADAMPRGSGSSVADLIGKMTGGSGLDPRGRFGL